MATTDRAGYARLGLLNLVAFSGPNLCIGALAVAVGVYLPRYYAGHIGLGLQQVGLAFMAVRLVDTFFDPLLGVAMDKTRTRFGRYRPWLAFGAPVMMIAAFMLFDPPAGVSVFYLLAWLFCYYIGFSLITLSHASWASAIASSYNERSRVFGAIQMVGVVGATIALTLPVAMGKLTKGPSPVQAMGWFIVGAAGIGALAALISTREQVSSRAPDRASLGEYWAMLSRPDMRRIIIADFCLALGPGWMSALYLFYFHEARGFTIVSASLLLLIYVFAGILGAVVMSRLAVSIGKHRTLMGAAVGYSLGLIAMLFLPKGAFALVAPFMFLMGFLASSFPLLDRAMVADVGDAVRLEQGKHRVGLLYAAITTSQKLALALAIGLSYTVLGLIGYQAKDGVTNTPQAIFGMELVYVIGPVFFVMLGGACFIGYKLDARRHAQIRDALADRDAIGTEAPIIESLGGQGGLDLNTIEPA